MHGGFLPLSNCVAEFKRAFEIGFLECDKLNELVTKSENKSKWFGAKTFSSKSNVFSDKHDRNLYRLKTCLKYWNVILRLYDIAISHIISYFCYKKTYRMFHTNWLARKNIHWSTRLTYPVRQILVCYISESPLFRASSEKSSDSATILDTQNMAITIAIWFKILEKYIRRKFYSEL